MVTGNTYIPDVTSSITSLPTRTSSGRISTVSDCCRAVLSGMLGYLSHGPRCRSRGHSKLPVIIEARILDDFFIGQSDVRHRLAMQPSTLYHCDLCLLSLGRGDMEGRDPLKRARQRSQVADVIGWIPI